MGDGNGEVELGDSERVESDRRWEIGRLESEGEDGERRGRSKQ